MAEVVLTVYDKRKHVWLDDEIEDRSNVKNDIKCNFCPLLINITHDMKGLWLEVPTEDLDMKLTVIKLISEGYSNTNIQYHMYKDTQYGRYSCNVIWYRFDWNGKVCDIGPIALINQLYFYVFANVTC